MKPVEQRGTKYIENKIRWDLMPLDALEQVALVFTHGAIKYDADNWRKGIPYREVIGSCFRHLTAFARGQQIDPKSNLPHLAHLGFWAIAILHFCMNDYARFDDRTTDANDVGRVPEEILDKKLWEGEK